MTKSTITRNGAVANGGGAGIINRGGSVTVTNTTIGENQSGKSGIGGGILNWGAVMMTNSAIIANFGDDGGGGIENLYSGSMTLKNTIVAFNFMHGWSIVMGFDCMGTITSAGNNLGCGLTGPGDLGSVDPILGPLADNGGPPAQTYALLPGSPAVDAGDSLACPAVDQRDISWPIDGNGDGTALCDIGPYEADWSPQQPTVFNIEVGIDTPWGSDLMAATVPGGVMHILWRGPDDWDRDGREELLAIVAAMDFTADGGLLGQMTFRTRDPWIYPNGLLSSGQIEETVNQIPGVLEIPPFAPGGSADASFDLFLMVEVPQLQRTAYNDIPLGLEGTVSRWPPAPGDTLQMVDGPTGLEITSFTVSAVLPVGIDVKPYSDTNRISSNMRGAIPVAILSSPDFDAPSEVDKDSLTFGSNGDEDSLIGCLKTPRDVNDDGLLDQVCHFRAQDTRLQCGDSEGILTGKTVAAVPLEGGDSVRVVPCR